jgi:hypothetical protein
VGGPEDRGILASPATSPVNEMSQTLDPEDAANGLLTNVLLLL